MPFFPLKDERTYDATPVLTFVFVAFNVLAYGLSAMVVTSDNREMAFAFLNDFAVIPSQLLGRDPASGVLPEWTTLVTANFLHGGLEHLVGNMVFFWIFADNIEAAFGHVRFLLFCLLAGVASMGAQALFYSTDVPVLGFSGVVSAVLGAYLVLYPKAKVELLSPTFFWAYLRMPLTFSVTARWIIPLWFVQDFYFWASRAEDVGIAYMAHIGGLFFGLAAAKLLHVNHGWYELRELRRRELRAAIKANRRRKNKDEEVGDDVGTTSSHRPEAARPAPTGPSSDPWTLD
ncbi:MAG: rhomboid family intramembrane serine protease [Alphaproteobacteria bacterium]|nr:rhomboid family intramembrane serine protease [Alphaproteobacteria bacterium]